jgi:hypothetical protein
VGPVTRSSFLLLALAALACSGDNATETVPQPVDLPEPVLLQIGDADTTYNIGTHLELFGDEGRFRLAGVVSLPGPTYTIEPDGIRLGLNVTIHLSTATIPGTPPVDDLSGRTLVVEWELPKGVYRILVQDDIKALLERVIEVD